MLKRNVLVLFCLKKIYFCSHEVDFLVLADVLTTRWGAGALLSKLKSWRGVGQNRQNLSPSWRGVGLGGLDSVQNLAGGLDFRGWTPKSGNSEKGWTSRGWTLKVGLLFFRKRLDFKKVGL